MGGDEWISLGILQVMISDHGDKNKKNKNIYGSDYDDAFDYVCLYVIWCLCEHREETHPILVLLSSTPTHTSSVGAGCV